MARQTRATLAGRQGRRYASTRRLAGRASGPLNSPGDWNWLLGGEYQGARPATEAMAMGVPAFGRGVWLLANAVADTDWHAARWDADTGVYQRLAAQPAVVTEPDPTVPAWNYRWAAAEDGVLFGNHFAFYGAPDSTGYPAYLVPVPADDVWLMVDPENGSYWLIINGESWSATDVLHVAYGNRSGEVFGRGVLAQYCEWLGGTVAAELHAGSYFAGGAMPPAVLQSPNVLTQDQADELKGAWRSVANTREPVVLPMGYVLTPLISNAEQNQLVQSRQWNSEAVAMLLGIPPYKLGLPGTTMTYQNVETADIDFVRDSVSRYASPLAAAFSKWLVPRGTVVRFDYTGRMRADQRTTADVLTQLTGANILSLDEARAVLGRPPAAITLEPETTPADVPELTPAEVT
jgi:HK97 family phage portal protein